MDTENSREGGKESDADSTSEITLSALGKEAADLFKAEKFDECLSRLYEIKARKGDDPKVLHNIGIAEYYKNNSADSEKLLKSLSALKAQTEALARKVKEQVDTAGTSSGGGGNAALANSSSSPAVSSSEEKGTVPAGSSSADGGLAGDTAEPAQELDTTIASVNIGSLLFQAQQYAAAQSVLEPLYRNIEPIDESAALHICILLMDIALSSYRPDKAAAVLAYVEKSFGYLLAPGDGGTAPSSSQLSSSAAQVTATADVGLPPPEAPHAESSDAALVGGAEEDLARDPLEEGLEDEGLSLSLELPDAKQVAALGSAVGGAGRLSGGHLVSKTLPALPPELKLLLHLYKGRLLILTRNIKATKREVKAALGVSRDHVQGLLLKAQLEYDRANCRKAIRLLTSSGSFSDPSVSAMVLSNLAHIHERLGKHHTAALYLSKALQKISPEQGSQPHATQSSHPKPPSASISLSILYNAGLQQLLHGNPLLAARCFQEAGALYYNRPLLWFRLAECCIVAYERGLVGVDPAQEPGGLKEGGVLVAVAGGGRWRRIILQPGGLHASRNSLGINILEEAPDSESQVKLGSASATLRASELGQSGAGGEGGASLGGHHLGAESSEPSLEYGRSCLLNALHLLRREAADAEAEAAGFGSGREQGDGSGTGPETSSEVDQRESGRADAGNSAAPPAKPGGSSSGKAEKGGAGSALEVATHNVVESRRAQQQSILRPWGLASLAYLELCLANPLSALHAAHELLELPGCLPPYTFLGHTYAAEALCWLDRPAEAAEHLATCLAEQPGSEVAVLGPRDEDGQKWRSGDHSEASADGEDGGSTGGSAGHIAMGQPNLADLTGPNSRASLYVNLAAVYAMQGEVLQAEQCALQALSIAPASPLPMLAVVHVELCRGRTQDALAMLKHCRHVRVARSRTGFPSPPQKA